MTRHLQVVAYHYVRDLPRTAFPKINGMLTSEFRRQVSSLRDRYEMATEDSAMAFLEGRYHPSRDLCLLTFDDGLKEHHAEVTPILAGLGIQGLFFVITGCVEHRRVAPVHMNHFLMASLEFAHYRDLFMDELGNTDPEAHASAGVDAALAERTYRWDTPDVAAFKYLLNFGLAWNVRDAVVRALFERHVSSETPFAESLYVNWEEARAMESAGMVIGGHSHQHKPLGLLDGEELERDLTSCRDLLTSHLATRSARPFCYPYGKGQACSVDVEARLREVGFSCAFTTIVGDNEAGANPYRLRRIDCNDVAAAAAGGS